MKSNCQQHMQIKLLNGKGNLILFGPPGIGKTTLINSLYSLGLPVFDLERLATKEERVDWVRSHTGFIVGAADISPTMHYKHSANCLLTMESQSAYDNRRACRDADDPCKADQKHHRLKDWIGSHPQQTYHYMVSVDGDISKVCQKILNRFQNLAEDEFLRFRIRRARARLYKGGYV